MAKLLETLVKEYEFKTGSDYFAYIVESLINGQRQQVRDLFNQMKKDDKADFLNNFLCSELKNDREVKAICILELCT